MSENQPGLVYLITGGSGFLGKHLVRLLLEEEDKAAEIRVFDKCPDPRLNELSTGEKNPPVSSCVKRVAFMTVFTTHQTKHSHKYEGFILNYVRK